MGPSDEDVAREAIAGAREEQPEVKPEGPGDMTQWELELAERQRTGDVPAVPDPERDRRDELAALTPGHFAHSLPEPVAGYTIECAHCRGQGVLVRTVGDLLGESVALIEDAPALVLAFYRNLLDAAPYLAELFPADLLTAAVNDEGSRGARQRDRLLEALLALADLYRPDDPERMERLDNALISMGNRHAAFYRPSTGTVRGATVAEYAAVKDVFLVTVHDLVRGWRGEHDLAWDEAYEYAARGMLAAQHEWLKANPGAVMPRHRRESR